MIIICKDLKRVPWTKYPEKYITVGKSYPVVTSNVLNYYIVNDGGKVYAYSKSLFQTQQEWRDTQLNSIL